MTSIDVSGRLTETITVKRVTSHSAAGDAVRGTTISMSARIERGDSEGAVADGKDAVTAARVFTTSALLVGDLVFFPEDNVADDDTGRRVGNVVRHVALDGTFTHYTSTV